jgi:thiol-disulfide isomerase/thioredoxin
MFAENVYVHIAEKYYIPEAKWSSPEFIKDLKDKIVNKKTCLVGNIAKNITFRQIPNDSVKIIGLISQLSKFKTDGLEIEKSKANDAEKSNSKANILNNYFKTSGNLSTLYDIKADYIILWFWTPDCSHCKKETPEFYKLYLEKSGDKKNIQVITLFLSKDLEDWSKHTKINEEWLEYLKDNQLNKWINVWNPFDPFRSNYDISSSPVLYLLDKNYKILAKRIGFEQAFEVIENDKQ